MGASARTTAQLLSTTMRRVESTSAGFFSLGRLDATISPIPSSDVIFALKMSSGGRLLVRNPTEKMAEHIFSRDGPYALNLGFQALCIYLIQARWTHAHVHFGLC